jgi:hypothetical protein
MYTLKFEKKKTIDLRKWINISHISYETSKIIICAEKNPSDTGRRRCRTKFVATLGHLS